MSRPRPPQPAKLVIGILTAETRLLGPVARKLELTFGGIDLISPWWPFDYTDYYRREMGGPLFRRILAFHTLVEQDLLPEIKIKTNKLEGTFSDHGRRRVNLDPGYLLLERFVLATGKNYSHRICVGQGIYADLTLIYRQGAYRTLDWTYPDYGGAAIRDFLHRVRKKYSRDLKGSAQR